MLSPSFVKQIPVRSSLQLQLQLLSRISQIGQIWLPVNSKSTDIYSGAEYVGYDYRLVV